MDRQALDHAAVYPKSEAHAEHLRRKYGRVPPWPFVTQRTAARRLGVSVEYLQGMANNPIPAVKCIGKKSGGTVWLFEAAAIDGLVEKVTAQP